MSKRPRLPGAVQREIRKAQQKAERERRKKAALLLNQYLSIDAVFAERRDEKLLREAIEGLDPFDDDDVPEIFDEVGDAIEVPDTVAGLWKEYQAWQRLIDERLTFQVDYAETTGVYFRMRLLEDALDKVPSTSLDDIMARISWARTIIEDDLLREKAEDIALLERLRADVNEMYVHLTGG